MKSNSLVTIIWSIGEHDIRYSHERAFLSQIYRLPSSKFLKGTLLPIAFKDNVQKKWCADIWKFTIIMIEANKEQYNCIEKDKLRDQTFRMHENFPKN